MQLSSKLLSVLLLSAILVSCSSPSGSKKEELELGTFKAQTTGAFENNFFGDATFSIDTLEDYQEQYLHLSLDAGKVPFAPDNVIGNRYGIFLSAPWDSTNTVTLENSMLVSLYVVPNSIDIMYLFSGSIIIDEKSSDLLSGEIKLTKELASPDSGMIEINGKFKAIPSE